MCEVMHPLEPCDAYRNLLLEHYVGLLQQRKPFSFARYADGEWNVIIRSKAWWRCRAVQSLEAMQHYTGELRHTVHHPHPYYYGMKPYGWRLFKKGIQRLDLKIDWVLSAVFHRANVRGQLGLLIRQLREHPVCLVGPACLKPLTFLTSAGHVTTPFPGVYESKDKIIARIREIASGHPDLVVAFSAAGVANLLIYDLYPELGGRATLIDFGAMWEPYVGQFNLRLYHKHMTPEILKRNLM